VLSLAPLAALLAASRAHAGVALPPLDGAPAASPFEVTVSNTGDVDADDAVLGFLTPPGAGKGGVPLQSLFGFERVHVKAGASVSVFLYPALTDFVVTDSKGDRHPLPGQYKVSFGLAGKGMAYAEAHVRATL
jgi:beta-D-xylosidase 4